MRLTAARIAPLLAALAVVGCGGGDTTTVIQRTTTTVESTAPSTASTTSTTTATETTTTERSGIDTSGSFTFFQLPSGNIACAMSRRDVRCDIRNYSYSPPPQPGSCPLDWGDSISLDDAGARFACHGDTVFDPGAAVLGYGAQVSRDGFSCSSDEQTGVSCSSDTGHGFTLARQAYDIG